MLVLGAGKFTHAQCLLIEDVCGYGKNDKPRHGNVNRNFEPELERLQSGRIAAFKEFWSEVASGGYPEAAHTVQI